MTYTDHEIDFSNCNEQIIAIEFLFESLPRERCLHLERVIKDNIEYQGLHGHWTYDLEGDLKSMKVTHHPIAYDMMSPEMEPMLKSIKREMQRTIKAYNKLCGTEIEYDSFKLHFLDTMPFPECD